MHFTGTFFNHYKKRFVPSCFHLFEIKKNIKIIDYIVFARHLKCKFVIKGSILYYKYQKVLKV